MSACTAVSDRWCVKYVCSIEVAGQIDFGLFLVLFFPPQLVCLFLDTVRCCCFVSLKEFLAGFNLFATFKSQQVTVFMFVLIKKKHVSCKIE